MRLEDRTVLNLEYGSEEQAKKGLCMDLPLAFVSGIRVAIVWPPLLSLACDDHR